MLAKFIIERKRQKSKIDCWNCIVEELGQLNALCFSLLTPHSPLHPLFLRLKLTSMTSVKTVYSKVAYSVVRYYNFAAKLGGKCGAKPICFLWSSLSRVQTVYLQFENWYVVLCKQNKKAEYRLTPFHPDGLSHIQLESILFLMGCPVFTRQ